MTAKKDVVNWKEKLAEDAKAVALQERPAVGYVSLRGGTMTYMQEEVPGNAMDSIVLAAGYERTFYNRAFDPDDQSPPDCYARSDDEATMAPASNVEKPVHDVCHSCPNAQWNSAPQGKGQACKMRRKLIMAPGDGGETLAILNTPPTSNTAWSTYANKVAASLALPPWAVITTIKCVPFKTYFKLEFDCKGQVDEGMLPGLHKRAEDAKVMIMEEMDLSGAEDEAPAKTSKKY